MKIIHWKLKKFIKKSIWQYLKKKLCSIYNYLYYNYIYWFSLWTIIVKVIPVKKNYDNVKSYKKIIIITIMAILYSLCVAKNLNQMWRILCVRTVLEPFNVWCCLLAFLTLLVFLPGLPPEDEPLAMNPQYYYSSGAISNNFQNF